MATSSISFLTLSSLTSPPLRTSNSLRLASPSQFPPSLKPSKLSSSFAVSGPPLLTTIPSAPYRISPPFAVFAHKGYKMKTHKASAKRFRVTGRGKIVRRRAGKQHLLAKKNTKRKNRLSKTIGVDKSDYDNVIGALPYLKVNRNAT